MSEKKGDNRSRISIWIDALRRAYIWSFIADKKGMILLTEYPKSGGTWVCQMLSEYTDLPFQRNERARIIPSILHGHRSYSKSFKNVVCVIRDGRDIMVSAYYHFLFSNDKNNNSYMYAMQKKMPFDDFDNIKRNMPQFIKFMFTEKPNLVYNDNWSQFVTGWHGKDVNYVRYEQLLIDPVKELSPVLEKITGLKIDIVKLQNTIEKFSFKNLTSKAWRRKYQ